jgi:hypothetical protein
MVGGSARRAGDWECLLCGNVNFGHRVKCNRCEVRMMYVVHTTSKFQERFVCRWQCRQGSAREACTTPPSVRVVCACGSA